MNNQNPQNLPPIGEPNITQTPTPNTQYQQQNPINSNRRINQPIGENIAPPTTKKNLLKKYIKIISDFFKKFSASSNIEKTDNTDDSNTLKIEFISRVQQEVQLRTSYFLLLICSSIIATFGLLINSTAVVIGAMLIAPLFWPILGITLSTVSSTRYLTKTSVLNLVLSIIIVLTIGTIITFITPVHEISSEIQARANPTIIDLFIALASSVIGVAAIYYPKISSSATGVAISIALLPPLCVSGIGIALRDFDIFIGAFLLFSANSGAIIFVGIVTLYILQFRPNHEQEEMKLKVGLLSSFVFLFILSIPLSFYLYQTITQINTTKQINHILSTQIQNISQKAMLDDIEVSFLRSDTVQISSNVFFPEGVFLTSSQQNQIINNISQNIKQKVDLQLNVINTLLIKAEDDAKQAQIRSDMEEFLRVEISRLEDDAVIDYIEITLSDNITNRSTANILLQVKKYEDDPLSFNQKKKLDELLNRKYPNYRINLDVEFIPVTRVEDIDENTRIKLLANEIFERDLIFLSRQAFVAESNTTFIHESDNTITLKIVSIVFIPENTIIKEGTIKKIEGNIAKELGYKANIDLKILTYKNHNAKTLVSPKSEE